MGIVKVSSAFVCIRVRTCNSGALSIPTGGKAFCSGVVALFAHDGTLRTHSRRPTVKDLLGEMYALTSPKRPR